MIIYAVVSRATDAVVLCEHSNPEIKGTASQATIALIEKLSNASYSDARAGRKLQSKNDTKLLSASGSTPSIILNGERKTFVQRGESSRFNGDNTSPSFFHQFWDACSGMTVFGETETEENLPATTNTTNTNTIASATTKYQHWSHDPDNDHVQQMDTIHDGFFHVFYKDDVFFVCFGDDPDTRDQKVYVASSKNISLVRAYGLCAGR
jgi:hypothetical protein